MALSSILAATDFSPLSDRAVERAAQLARRHHCPLHLLHVLPRFPWDSVGRMFFEHPLVTEKRLYESAIERLQAIAAGYGRSHAIPVHAYVDMGTPQDCIAEYGRRNGIGLTVLGPHADSAAQNLFVGATALKTLHGCTAPVLVAKRASKQPYRKVLAAIDFTGISPRVLGLAEQIAPDAEIHAVHVYEALFEGKMRYAGVEDELIQRYIKSAGDDARGRMEKLLQETGRQDGVVPWLRHGHPSRTIVDVAHLMQADLVVMGKHSREGIDRLMLGSVVQGVLYGLDRDLAVVAEHAA